MRTGRGFGPSALRGRESLFVGSGFLREKWWLSRSSPGTQTHSHSLCSGLPVPPRCPKTGLEPLTLGEAARWSPGVPPPLGFQNANWLAGQPIPHHAPWESSEALRYHLGYRLGTGEMSAAWAWGLRTYTSPPPRQSQGARVVTFPYLYVHRNLSLSASLGRENYLKRCSKLLSPSPNTLLTGTPAPAQGGLMDPPIAHPLAQRGVCMCMSVEEGLA